jgi:hypothetical protein
MIHFDTLIKGLIIFMVGLIFLAIKNNMKGKPDAQYTGVIFVLSTYGLLCLGVLLIVWSFFE